MKALINIDYTVDFVTGALPCGEPAIKIEDEIAKITEEFISGGDYVVFAIDIHKENDPYHPETVLYPPHNIAGTEGRQLYGKLREVYEKYKDRENVYWMDKRDTALLRERIWKSNCGNGESRKCISSGYARTYAFCTRPLIAIIKDSRSLSMKMRSPVLTRPDMSGRLNTLKIV